MQIISIGVKSFKIEGRLKGPEYVAITTKAYRLAVDEAWRVLHLEHEEGTKAVSGSSLKETNRPGSGNPEEMKMIMNENVNIKNLKKKVSSSSSSTVRFNGLDAELMRDLKQVFSRGQDEAYDGLSAGEAKRTDEGELISGVVGRRVREREKLREIVCVRDREREKERERERLLSSPFLFSLSRSSFFPFPLLYLYA